MSQDIDAQLLETLREILGEKGIREEADDLLPDIILKPSTTDQVSAVLRACNDASQAIVPIGGRCGAPQQHTGNPDLHRETPPGRC